MPQASVVEWIAGGTLPRQRRQKSPEVLQSETVPSHSMGAKSNSGCCPTCCSCSSGVGWSEASTVSPSKRVRFKQPKGILKSSRRVDKEEHICCSACSPSAHCNERHTVGKNGKVYGSSKKCSPKAGKKEVDNWGEPRSTPNSPRELRDTSDNNYPIYQNQLPTSPPQTPEQQRTLQNISSFITKNMSRLILPSRAEVIIREDVLENPSDPRPNAFFDARTGMLRVYHGPMYGNPGGSLVPLQAQHVPIGTPAPPTSAWTNPWAGMMGGMTGRWPFGVSQRGGGGDQGMQHGGPTGNKNYSSGNKFNRSRNNSRGKVEQHGNDDIDNGSSPDTGDSQPMPGSFNNDDNQNDNSGWGTSNDSGNDNSNDDAWGTGNDTTNNDSPDNGGQVDSWGTDNNNSPGNDDWGTNNNNKFGNDNWGTNNNNTSSGDDNWGTNNNNNTSSGDNNWGSGPDNSNNSHSNSNSTNNNNSGWSSGYKNRPNQNGPSQRLFPDATGTEFSAGSWGEPTKQESWGDKTAAQSTKNKSDDTSGW
ncbi:hypothetical protein V495_04874 [Pseudogymnoascus sp. VKM F-4514 (FW-929)]|nr:hypothetical protein V495_04874 [Pseudogymnoascus sp. VKM F-4514 (FW-929)]KFY54161.1 hypothetical protein V497_07900 [Pseudogymnoascus sp. VKM F-4516 (FW-969)]